MGKFRRFYCFYPYFKQRLILAKCRSKIIKKDITAVRFCKTGCNFEGTFRRWDYQNIGTKTSFAIQTLEWKLNLRTITMENLVNRQGPQVTSNLKKSMGWACSMHRKFKIRKILVPKRTESRTCLINCNSFATSSRNSGYGCTITKSEWQEPVRRY